MLARLGEALRRADETGAADDRWSAEDVRGLADWFRAAEPARDPDLRRVVAAWPALSPALRAAVVALVDAAGTTPVRAERKENP